jgi:hypothetical protein
VRRVRTRVLGWTAFLTLAAVLGLVGGSRAVVSRTADARRLPVPGTTLRHSNLHLVVAASPPVTVDLDARRVSTIDVPGTPVRPGTPSVVALGRAAAVLGVVECDGCGRNQAAFLVRPGERRARPIGRAAGAAPAGRSGAWLLRVVSPQRCAIQRVTATGQSRPRASRCAGILLGQTPPGLIVNNRLLEDPVSGRVLLRAYGMVAASGSFVLRSPARRRLLLQGIRTRAEVRLPWPSRYAFTEGAVPRPTGGQIAVWFVSGPVDQHIDVWLLDVATRRLAHVPGFPVAAELKRTSLTWTPDGRLVILTHMRGSDALVVWRPGARRSASAFLALPASRGDGVAAW